MAECRTISDEEYRWLCVKAFNFEKFCSIMEDADPEEFEYTALKMYDLYATYIRRELKDLREEKKEHVEI